MESFILEATQLPKSIMLSNFCPTDIFHPYINYVKKMFEGWFKKFSYLKIQSYVILDVIQLLVNFDFIKIIKNNKIFISTLCYDNVLD
jgi:hypothetical protein